MVTDERPVAVECGEVRRWWLTKGALGVGGLTSRQRGWAAAEVADWLAARRVPVRLAGLGESRGPIVPLYRGASGHVST